MIDPEISEKVSDLRVKLEEVNTIIAELRRSNVDVVVNAGKETAVSPVEIKLARCWGTDEYITNK